MAVSIYNIEIKKSKSTSSTQPWKLKMEHCNVLDLFPHEESRFLGTCGNRIRRRLGDKAYVKRNSRSVQNMCFYVPALSPRSKDVLQDRVNLNADEYAINDIKESNRLLAEFNTFNGQNDVRNPMPRDYHNNILSYKAISASRRLNVFTDEQERRL